MSHDMPQTTHYPLAALLVSLAVGIGLAPLSLAAQTGQVEVWIPHTTRSIVVEVLTQQLAKTQWTFAGATDYGARYERPSATILDAVGHATGQPTTDRLRVTFHDLADTLRVIGSLATVTYPGTATEQITGRDDPKAVQEVAAILGAAKQVAQNRRTSSAATPTTEVTTSTRAAAPPLPMDTALSAPTPHLSGLYQIGDSARIQLRLDPMWRSGRIAGSDSATLVLRTFPTDNRYRIADVAALDVWKHNNVGLDILGFAAAGASGALLAEATSHNHGYFTGSQAGDIFASAAGGAFLGLIYELISPGSWHHVRK